MSHTPTLRLCALADGVEKMLDSLGTDVLLNPSYWAYVVHDDKVIGIVRAHETPIVTRCNSHDDLMKRLALSTDLLEIDAKVMPEAEAAIALDCVANNRALLSQLEGQK